MVPAVSIMSSSRTQGRPSTLPMTSRASTAFFWPATWRLWTMAMSAPSLLAYFSATFTRPVSGDTMTRSSGMSLRQ